MPKLSIVIPVYYNAENLLPLYEDLREKLLNREGPEYELVFVDDGSGDNSYEVLRGIADRDARVRLYRLSRNFGSDAAVLCGLVHATGDCAVVKAADLQEPTEMLLEMYEKWVAGDQIVLAVREGREESKMQELFANLYYALTRKVALPNMPKTGFDVFLLDRKVIDVIGSMNESNSALSGLVLWSGFRTGTVTYVRRARKIGKSRWTLKKKVRLVMDTLFSFSTLPITMVSALGGLSVVGSVLWAIDALVSKLTHQTKVEGWTMLFIFNLMSFGVVMLTLGLLGGYLWRTFDASRKRPPFIVAETYSPRKDGKNAQP
ncbi:MAG TPA: glycosyltransferase family 2 protein [Candidatus Limiplasma sp.]|nr:glycosyltransferase family 2 protein [Candidatus Limiplasma sp.]HPS81771.1 glycosyltransferase family 2 protein [Candidatus Limiplasma sp.]